MHHSDNILNSQFTPLFSPCSPIPLAHIPAAPNHNLLLILLSLHCTVPKLSISILFTVLPQFATSYTVFLHKIMNTILGKKYCVFPHRGRMPICVKCQISFYFNDRSKSANWYLCSPCQDFTSSLQGKAVPCRRWSGKAKSLSGFLWKQSSFPIGMADSYFLSYSDVLKTCATWNGISPHVNLCIPQFLFHFPWSHQRPSSSSCWLMPPLWELLLLPSGCSEESLLQQRQTVWQDGISNRELHHRYVPCWQPENQAL